MAFIPLASLRKPFDPQAPLVVDDMIYLLKIIALYGVQDKILSKPPCGQITSRAHEAVRYQVIREDLQKAYDEKEFSDVLNAGVFPYVSPLSHN